MPEPRLVAQDLIVHPAVDDAFPEPPFLAQLGGGDALLLRPLVDRLRRQPEILGHLLEREDVGAVVAGHGWVRWVESGESTNGGITFLSASARVAAGSP